VAEWGGVLHTAGDAKAPRPAEGAVHGGDEADRDAAPAARLGQGEDRGAEAHGRALGAVGGSGRRPRVAGVDRDNWQVG
jgi:hypothetical protein